MRKTNRNFEEWRLEFDDSEDGQSENDRNQIQGGLIGFLTYGGGQGPGDPGLAPSGKIPIAPTQLDWGGLTQFRRLTRCRLITGHLLVELAN